jgi:pimeloyl-ACP methyl ester carboxylesterase
MRIQQDERWMLVGGCRLLVKSWNPPGGDRQPPPILLFHDSLGCVALWRTFPAALALATGRRVIAYDRLGFGRSDPHPGKLPPDFVRDEAQRIAPDLLGQLGVQKFVACGHSVGGAMAIETAANLPGRCRSLITIAAQARVDEIILEGIRRAKREFEDPSAFAKLEKHHGDKARWVLNAWTETWLSPDRAHWTLDGALAAVRCPVLAIHGGLDEYTSTEHPAHIASGRGAAHIFPNNGHVLHRECPDILIKQILNFLTEIRGGEI